MRVEQKAYFDTFGFLFMRQLFSPKEMTAITREVDDVLSEDRQGQPVPGEGQTVVKIVERRPLLTQLAEDDRIYTTIEGLLGSGFIWGGSESHITTVDHLRWHADRPGEEELGYIRIKVMIYLDPLDKDSGCLRVIPTSHRLPLHMEIEPDRRHQYGPIVMPFGVAGEDMPCFPLESHPGDVIFFNQCLWHAVFKASTGRHYFALKFAAKPTTDEHIASLHHYSRGVVFQPHEAFLNSNRPRIRGMVEGLVDLGSRCYTQDRG